METTIAALKEELAVTRGEREEAIFRAESLASDLDILTEELELTNKELATLKEVSSLQLSLEEHKSCNQNLEGSVNVLIQEKEELAMQLTDALLLMEEEWAIWSSKEKASIKAIEDKSKSHVAEVALLLQQMSEMLLEIFLGGRMKNCPCAIIFCIGSVL